MYRRKWSFLYGIGFTVPLSYFVYIPIYFMLLKQMNTAKKQKKKKMFSVKVASIIKKTESFFLVWHKEASLRTLNRWEVVSTPRKEGLGF